jgi:hypothetical protein
MAEEQLRASSRYPEATGKIKKKDQILIPNPISTSYLIL